MCVRPRRRAARSSAIRRWPPTCTGSERSSISGRSACRRQRTLADMPGAPSWLRPLAAVTLAEGGHRDSARALFEQLAQSEEPWLRDSARLRLAQLDAMDTIDALRPKVQAFRQAHPGEPVTWARI